MESVLLLLSVILLAGVWAARVGSRLGLPVLIVFVAIGVLLGPGGFHIASAVPLTWAHAIGYVALILILFEGGLHTSIERIRGVWAPALSLATVGVLLSSLVMGALAYFLLRLPFYPSALLGVAVSSTDAASVFTMLGGQPLRKRLVDVLEVESGTNDPMAFFLTLVLIQWSVHGTGPFWTATGAVLGTFALQMLVGLAVGIATGYLGSFANQRIKLDTGGLYPTLSLAFALLSFAVANLLHGSGFLSVYVASVVMGNRRMEHRHSIMRFHEGLAWTMHILMFVVLGLEMVPHRLVTIFLPGIGLALGALVFARPFAVWLSTLGMGFHWREKLFLSWAGLRGAVPIVLVLTATLAPGYTPNTMMDAVFFVVLASTLVQGLTVKPFAHKLSLLEPSPSEGLIELVAIARENAIVVPIEIAPESRLIDRKMVDIPFPDNTLCYAIVRDNRVIVPRGATRLKAADHLLVLSDRRHVDELRALFEGEVVGHPAFLP
ncbi:potassium/proton antiporter [Alicyclobacillus cycloheptanicus]|uniref:Cell volume regulation protein A n=1 Tax=Alicyclobacillus cycloheptanicus TaxID=1457 RepID=A0ABT9XGW9_9BACL|nr:potassium/proton antiporter [Alicyclobacillus cycloheptanicus]MDQ0189350.1 cell volume regulation protein A [Alicyclobacillus cycloheptanicus]WDM01296.1 potassium/proton antiporter [Alicyclobacillus cycloheptanicus]